MTLYKLENVLYSPGVEGTSASIHSLHVFGSVNLIIKQIDSIHSIIESLISRYIKRIRQ